MKITVEDRPIERIGVGVEQTFRVKGTAKAFRILSSSLYSDKIMAIIRELACNAWDSHKAAGKSDQPIHVHIPNTLEPYFRVKDNGLGLSHDDVLTLCTTYFESTKTDSNDMVGALGLGMKSPFSYVDSFTLVSRFQGEKRTYTMFINEDGMPAVTQMGIVEKTDECNGVEMVVPVRSGDFFSFEHRVKSALEFFTPEPVVEGAADFRIDKKEIAFSGPNFSISDMNYGKPRAIMGVVAYPISYSSIENDVLDQYKNVIRNLCYRPLDIRFGIGDLDVTAGREELSYDRKITIPNLIKTLIDVSVEIDIALKSAVEACKTEWEVRELYYRLNGLMALFEQNWNGKPLNNHFMRVKLPKSAENLAVSFYEDGRVNHGHLHAFKGMEESFCYVDIPVMKKTVVYINDMIRGAVSRLRLFSKTSDQFIIVVGGPDEYVDLFKEAIAGAPIFKVSELPKPASFRKPVSVKIFKNAERANRYYSYSELDEISITDEDHGFFVRTVSGKPVADMTNAPLYAEGISSFELGNTNINEILKRAREFKILNKAEDGETEAKVIFVPKTLVAEFENHPNWVELIPLVREQAIKRIEESNPGSAYAAEVLEKLWFLSEYNHIESIIANQQEFADHPITRLFSFREYVRNTSVNARQNDDLRRLFHISVPKPIVDVSKWENMMRKYVLLKHVSRHTNPEIRDEVIKFIRLVDNSKEKVS
jgi:hypothetical protein